MAFPLLMGIGLGISAFGKLAAGEASADAYEAQAIQARVAAVRRRLRASDDARMIEEQGSRFQANQAVGFAKSGVLLDSGSPLQTLMDTAIHVERNAMKTRLAGEWDAEGLESSASVYDKAAKGARLTGMFGAVGTFLTGAAAAQGFYKPSVGAGINTGPNSAFFKEGNLDWGG